MREMAMSSDEVDSILTILENPVRRKIIKRLSEEPSYPLQLAKELSLTQQLVAKHLALMEEAGVVKSSWRESPQGPRQRVYLLDKTVSITLDLAPHLFGAHFQIPHAPSKVTELHTDASRMMRRIQEIQGYKDNRKILKALSEVISEIDERLRNIEDERAGLLHVRDVGMQAAGEAIESLENVKERRRILYRVLDEQDLDADAVAQSLNMSETLVRRILAEIESWLE